MNKYCHVLSFIKYNVEHKIVNKMKQNKIQNTKYKKVLIMLNENTIEKLKVAR